MRAAIFDLGFFLFINFPIFITQTVEPKRARLAEAQALLADASAKLAAKQVKNGGGGSYLLNGVVCIHIQYNI